MIDLSATVVSWTNSIGLMRIPHNITEGGIYIPSHTYTYISLLGTKILAKTTLLPLALENTSCWLSWKFQEPRTIRIIFLQIFKMYNHDLPFLTTIKRLKHFKIIFSSVKFSYLNINPSINFFLVCVPYV